MVMKYCNSTKGFNHAILLRVWHGAYCIHLISQPKGLAHATTHMLTSPYYPGGWCSSLDLSNPLLILIDGQTFYSAFKYSIRKIILKDTEMLLA